MQHLSIAVSPPVFHIFSRFLGGAESPNVELSHYVIFIFLTVHIIQRFAIQHQNSCRGRRRGCATDFFWSAGFLFPNQSSCPISGRSVQPLWSAQKAVRLWGSITVLIIIGHLGNLFLFAPFPRSAITYDNRAILRCSTVSAVFPQPFLHQFCVFSHDFWWSR